MPYKKRVQLIHNPGAGDESHSGDKLKNLLEENGYQCSYASTKKKGWKDFDTSVDLVLIAGGDGTVRKVAAQVLQNALLDRPGPMALLPLGTANNVSRALKITDDLDTAIRSWDNYRTKDFDVGRVSHVKEEKFFLESFGYGVFPYLMQELKKKGEEFDAPEEKIRNALQVLHQVIQSYEPRHCKLQVDGTDHSGKFILAEIMNTPSIGPNLNISPLSDPGDGEFEVVLVPEQQKNKFLAYIEGKIEGREDTYSFHTLKGKDIQISWEGTHVHVDDQVVTLEKGEEVSIKLKKGLLQFLVPPAESKL